MCVYHNYASVILRCVVVGDGGVGKTSLLSTFATGVFPEDYVPTGHALAPETRWIIFVAIFGVKCLAIIFAVQFLTIMLLQSLWEARAMSLAFLTLQVSSGSLRSLIDQCDFADDDNGEYDYNFDDQD